MIPDTRGLFVMPGLFILFHLLAFAMLQVGWRARDYTPCHEPYTAMLRLYIFQVFLTLVSNAKKIQLEHLVMGSVVANHVWTGYYNMLPYDAVMLLIVWRFSAVGSLYLFMFGLEAMDLAAEMALCAISSKDVLGNVWSVPLPQATPIRR